jgi:hypothetical protein
MAKIKINENEIEIKTNIISISINGVEYVAKNGVITLPKEYARFIEIHDV